MIGSTGSACRVPWQFSSVRYGRRRRRENRQDNTSRPPLHYGAGPGSGQRIAVAGCREVGHPSPWPGTGGILWGTLEPAVSSAQRSQVTTLLTLMIDSINIQSNSKPNPSILMALRLARDHNLGKEHQLLQYLKDDAVTRITSGNSFTSGEVALDILAIMGSCQNPANVSAVNSSVNLLSFLSQKLEEEIDNVKMNNYPVTDYYQVSLSTLALCLANKMLPSSSVEILCDAAKNFTLAGTFSVDTAAVAVLALRCVDRSGKQDTIQNTLINLVSQILDTQKSTDTIGNIYSTGLAMQALCATSDLYPPLSWSCSQSLEKLVNEVPEGTFNNPMAASQAVPSMEGRTYLDLNHLDCSADQDNLTMTDATNSQATAPLLPDSTITYTIQDGINNSFTDSVTVSVPFSSPLLKVMEKAQQLYPDRFRFETADTLWGPVVTKIRHLKSSNNDRTYWQFLNGGTPIDQGVKDYVPLNDDVILAYFTTY